MENTHNKIFLVDLDGVIADFSLGVVNEYNKIYTPPFTLEQAENIYGISDKEPYKSIVGQPEFFANLPIMSNTLKGLEYLAKCSKAIYFCTKPKLENPYCELGKKEWVQKHLGPDWVRKIIFTKDKTLIRGDYLIDDKEQKGLLHPMWKQLLYDHPYNQTEYFKDYTRITWKSLLTKGIESFL